MANIDLFTPRTMIPMVTESTKRNITWLRDTFFPTRRTFPTKTIEFDVVGREGRILAPFVNPKMAGGEIQRDGYRTKTFEAPEISALMVTTAEDGFIRQPGEELYSERDPMQRVAAQLGHDLARLDEIITRREEAMCAEAIFTGKVTVKGVGYDEVVDFWGDLEEGQKPTDSTETKWDAGDKDAKGIVADIRRFRSNMINRGNFTPTRLLVGTEVIDVLLSKLSDAGMLDTRRVDLGQINPTLLPNGVAYWGYLKDSAIDIYTYENWYDNDAGEAVPLVPSKGAVLCAANPQTVIAYGACSCVDMQNGLRIVSAPRVPCSWIQERAPTGRVLQLKSRPLPIIQQVYGFTVLDVMTAS